MSSEVELRKVTLKYELDFIWAVNKKHGLNGVMRIFSGDANTSPWRPKDQNLEFWFDQSGIDGAIEQVITQFNNGKFPNTGMLLDPVVYKSKEGKEPLGAGINWCTAFCASKDMAPDVLKRMRGLGLMVETLHQGENEKAGVKVLC